jgi:hypothetical protein
VTITHVFQLINGLRQICNLEVASSESGKLERLMEDLEEIGASDRKTLIFSQFTHAYGLTWLSKALAEYRPLELHGEVPGSRREGIIAEFSDEPSRRVMLLNYAVGGVGLNLHAANYVYLFDRWWNPAVEDQAVKRAHRLGQRDRVFVRRFVCRSTIEERIVQALARKRRLFAQIVDEAHPERTFGLTEEEIFGLFGDLRVRPRRKADREETPRLMLENMSGEQFEVLVEEIYKAEGYAVRRTGRSHDAGIDLIAERRTASGREIVVVQCKNQAAPVGRPVVQQLWGVVQHDPRITQGHLVTSSSFAWPASRFAADKRLLLIDRRQVVELAAKHKIAQLA